MTRKKIKPNCDKVEYKKTQNSYSGHIISKERVNADPKKADAVKTTKTPEDKAAVQCLLGMIRYLLKFTPHLSEMGTPLRQLVKKMFTGKPYNRSKKFYRNHQC